MRSRWTLDQWAREGVESSAGTLPAWCPWRLAARRDPPDHGARAQELDQTLLLMTGIGYILKAVTRRSRRTSPWEPNRLEANLGGPTRMERPLSLQGEGGMTLVVVDA